MCAGVHYVQIVNGPDGQRGRAAQEREQRRNVEPTPSAGVCAIAEIDWIGIVPSLSHAATVQYRADCPRLHWTAPDCTAEERIGNTMNDLSFYSAATMKGGGSVGDTQRGVSV